MGSFEDHFESPGNKPSTDILLHQLVPTMGFPSGSASKESACNARDLGSIPGLERYPGEGKSYLSSSLARRIPWTV